MSAFTPYLFHATPAAYPTRLRQGPKPAHGRTAHPSRRRALRRVLVLSAGLAIVLGGTLAPSVAPGLHQGRRALAAGATFGVRLEIRAPVRVVSSAAVGPAGTTRPDSPTSAAVRVTATLATGAGGTLQRLPATRPPALGSATDGGSTAPGTTVVTFLIQ